MNTYRYPTPYTPKQIYPQFINRFYKYEKQHTSNIFVSHETLENWYSNNECDKMKILLSDYPKFSKTSYEFIRLLYYYCIEYDDSKLFRKILNKYGFDKEVMSNHIVTTCCVNNRLDIFRNILEHGQPNYEIVCDIITYCDNPITFLDIMLEFEFKMFPIHINAAVFSDKFDVVNYAFANGYDVIGIFGLFGIEFKLSLPMLKLLLDNGIDISDKLKYILINAVENFNLDVLAFVIESFPEHNINYLLNMCCELHNADALLYLLRNGANIHSVDLISTLVTSLDIIKIFVAHSHPPPEHILTYHLIRRFIRDELLTDINYLIGIGANIQWIFDRENDKDHHLNYLRNKEMLLKDHKYDTLSSILEYIVSKGKINHIMFLASDYLSILQPEINRLFIIACANGQCDMALYLLDLGAELDNKALVSACFFGHLEIVILLLKLGMDIYSITDNLYTVTKMGNSPKCSKTFVYDDLINNNTIFRNDVYKYGNKYVDIIKLLIEYDVPAQGIVILYPYNSNFYDIDIFKFYIKIGLDINIKWKSPVPEYCDDRNFLEGSIIFDHIDIVEFLLESGVIPNITDTAAIRTINKNKQIRDLLLKYDISV